MTDVIAQPVDASTVILVRHGIPIGSPWQCFMLRRHVKSEFAADVFVFPGGKVDEADRSPEAAEVVDDRLTAVAATAGSEESWRVLKLAAIREMFEEAGVLLAYRDGGQLVRFEGPEAARFAEYRVAMQRGKISMVAMAREAGLRLAADVLQPYSRWITPESLPRRYDTRFFVTEMPEAQEPLHDALETTDSIWISPKLALERYRQGEFPLVFATEKHLERMAHHHSLEEMLATVSPVDLTPVMPKIVQTAGEKRFLLPGDAEY